jgi:hypothetical protein
LDVAVVQYRERLETRIILVDGVGDPVRRLGHGDVPDELFFDSGVVILKRDIAGERGRGGLREVGVEFGSSRLGDGLPRLGDGLKNLQPPAAARRQNLREEDFSTTV